MEISDAGLEFIREWEKCRLKPYLDAAGKPTVGWGHLMSPYDSMDVSLTQDEADALFWADTLYTLDGMLEVLADVELQQHEFDAVGSLAFNVGLHWPTLLRYLRAGDRMNAADAFLAWNRAGGRVVNGLVKRRRAEREMFLHADYSGRP